MKKSILCLTVTLLLMVTILPATADSLVYSEIPTSGIPAEGNSSTVIVYGKPRLNSINGIESTTAEFSYGLASISAIGGEVVRGYGFTSATDTADEISYTLTFQIWTGYDWAGQGSYTVTENNVSSISDYHYKNGALDSRYRVRVVHSVTDDGINTGETHYSKYVTNY